MLLAPDNQKSTFFVYIVNRPDNNDVIHRCVAEDEELTLAVINMKLPFIKLSKVEPTKDGQKIQKSIGRIYKSETYLKLKNRISGSLIGINIIDLDSMGLEEVPMTNLQTTV